MNSGEGCFNSSVDDYNDDHHPVQNNTDFGGIVCCICGDVGFQDQLFKCEKCLRRFQHSYCSSSYLQAGWKIGVCEWCHYEDKRRTSGISCKRRNVEERGDLETQISAQEERKNGLENSKPSDHAVLGREGEEESTHAKCSKNSLVRDNKDKIAVGSPRPTNRRYKLLKDVLC
eukprot:Gb_04244 [translate_table: standard]